MPLRLIERTIIFDLLKITVLALCGASALLMLVGAMVEAARNGMDPLRVLLIMPYLILPTLPYTLPTCLLFACTVVYGGMSTANEITALKAGGIHVYRVLWPGVLLGVSLAAVSVHLVDEIIPACNRSFTAAIFSDIEGTLYAYLKQKGELREQKFPYELFVESVKDEKLLNPIIKQRSPHGGYDLVIQASSATLKVVETSDEQMELQIRLVDGVVASGTENTVRFHDRTERMPLPSLFNKSEPKTESLNFEGLREKSDVDLGDALALDLEILEIGAGAAMTGDFAAFHDRLEWNRNDAARLERKSKEAKAEVHLRIAQSMATIPFVLLGSPLSILFQRREFLRTFFVCFLPIITVYYPAMILSFNFFKEGQGGSVLTLWAPSILMCLVAIPFVRRVIRH